MSYVCTFYDITLLQSPVEYDEWTVGGMLHGQFGRYAVSVRVGLKTARHIWV
jgi:hypothetical protein